MVRSLSSHNCFFSTHSYSLSLCRRASIYTEYLDRKGFRKVFYSSFSTNIQNLVQRIRCFRIWSSAQDYAVIRPTKMAGWNYFVPVRYQLPKGTSAGLVHEYLIHRVGRIYRELRISGKCWRVVVGGIVVANDPGSQEYMSGREVKWEGIVGMTK